MGWEGGGGGRKIRKIEEGIGRSVEEEGGGVRKEKECRKYHSNSIPRIYRYIKHEHLEHWIVPIILDRYIACLIGRLVSLCGI